MDRHAPASSLPGYVDFPRLAHDDQKPILNRFSTFVTRDHDFPAAQVFQFLYPGSKTSPLDELTILLRQCYSQLEYQIEKL